MAQVAKTVDFELTPGSDARQVPLRLLFVQGDERPAVEGADEEYCMSFPHLVLREVITLLALLLFLTVVSLAFDAPLEELANADLTPNPAKAPWYFLGLQELLHYYPPFVAGVLLPGLVVVGLMVIPYFDLNLERAPFWTERRGPRLAAVAAAVTCLALFLGFSGAHPVWPAIVPTLLLGAIVLLPGVLGTRSPWLAWLGSRSLPFWIFMWFLAVATGLTAVGIFFRGPGWQFVLPWRDGVYY